MNIDIDLETGRAVLDVSLDELHEITAALAAVKENAPAAPDRPPYLPARWTYTVPSETTYGKSYETCIWFDRHGVKHGVCKCKDHTCRGGKWCKHLDQSDAERRFQLALRS